jgi:hypothetical protein
MYNIASVQKAKKFHVIKILYKQEDIGLEMITSTTKNLKKLFHFRRY